MSLTEAELRDLIQDNPEMLNRNPELRELLAATPPKERHNAKGNRQHRNWMNKWGKRRRIS